jgi:hypothetical protein
LSYFCADKARKQPRDWLVNSCHLHTTYNSEVCTTDYRQPRSSFLLLHYIPNAKTFLACRKVEDIKAAQSILENQPAPYHDVRYMSGSISRAFSRPTFQRKDRGLPPRLISNHVKGRRLPMGHHLNYSRQLVWWTPGGTLL